MQLKFAWNAVTVAALAIFVFVQYAAIYASSMMLVPRPVRFDEAQRELELIRAGRIEYSVSGLPANFALGAHFPHNPPPLFWNGHNSQLVQTCGEENYLRLKLRFMHFMMEQYRAKDLFDDTFMRLSAEVVGRFREMVETIVDMNFRIGLIPVVSSKFWTLYNTIVIPKTVELGIQGDEFFRAISINFNTAATIHYRAFVDLFKFLKQDKFGKIDTFFSCKQKLSREGNALYKAYEHRYSYPLNDGTIAHAKCEKWDTMIDIFNLWSLLRHHIPRAGRNMEENVEKIVHAALLRYNLVADMGAPKEVFSLMSRISEKFREAMMDDRNKRLWSSCYAQVLIASGRYKITYTSDGQRWPPRNYDELFKLATHE